MTISGKIIGGHGLSARREEAIDRFDFTRVDYSREDQVKRAREAITGMGTIDRAIDLVYRDGEKARMLNAIADMMLCHHGAIWKEKYPHAELAESLSKLNRDEVQIQFMDLLSPEGRRIMLGCHVSTPGGIRFSPNTGTKLDTLVSVTVTHDEAEKLLQNMANCSPYVSDHAWERHRENVSSGEAMMALARAHRGSGAYDSAASAHGTAALCFAEAGHMQAAAEAYANAVQDRDSAGEAGLAATEVGELAKMWEANDRHDLAANAWADQAERYQALNWLEPAAKARGRQARCAADANLHDIAQAGWLAQADIYRSLDRHDQAQESQKQAEKQGRLHRFSLLSALPPELSGEIAKHLDPEDAMSLAAALSGPEDLNATMRVLGAMSPDAYMAELKSGLPSIKRLHPDSRLGPLQLLVKKLPTLSASGRDGSHRAYGFYMLVKAATDLTSQAKLEVIEALARSIGSLGHWTAGRKAWSDCLKAIGTDENVKASRLPVWEALLDSSPYTTPSGSTSRHNLEDIVKHVHQLDPGDPDKGLGLMAVASRLDNIDPEDREKLIISLYEIARATGSSDSYKSLFLEAVDKYLDEKLRTRLQGIG